MRQQPLLQSDSVVPLKTSLSVSNGSGVCTRDYASLLFGTTWVGRDRRGGGLPHPLRGHGRGLGAYTRVALPNECSSRINGGVQPFKHTIL